jgi:hypothetical protein
MGDHISGTKSGPSSATMGNSEVSESLESDVELFDYLSSKKSRNDCQINVVEVVDHELKIVALDGSSAPKYETSYTYELAAQRPGTTGQKILDWNKVSLDSKFKMNLVDGNSTYVNSIKIDRDTNGNELLQYVIYTQNVTEPVKIFIPFPVTIGGEKNLHKNSGQLLFSANGELKSIQAKSEFLEKKLLGTQWKLLSPIVECGK